MGFMVTPRDSFRGGSLVEKRCFRCKQTKDACKDNFYGDNSRKDGLSCECRDCKNKRSSESHRKARSECLFHYSRGLMKCDCCPERHEEFLQIDHVGGGGNHHRRQIKTNNIYRWLCKHNFPEGFRVLCANCNLAIGARGYCPHEVERCVEAGL